MRKAKKGNGMKAAVLMVTMILAAALVGGCSAIIIPNPGDVVKHPLGTESIKVGMTKEQVEALWGRPSQVKIAEAREKWRGEREVWIYRAQYGSIPVDAGYLSNTKKLYFDGNNLTEIGE
ncbi:MAG: outer membrane protein assembly factor BamE [Candidatus Omnitrophica bacterium]|nr:outer membrane protein assembly factor BamE [Candidatus Omnitrophota bacterium]MDD5437081.1 outer membrane protein assembly factor BamE [Candidatus Omnitrophota bacterium]